MRSWALQRADLTEPAGFLLLRLLAEPKHFNTVRSARLPHGPRAYASLVVIKVYPQADRFDIVIEQELSVR